ncbi:MAG: hypothetical protein AUJ72_00410 [Candidatus Omnitrophica bacterium CG1_02_46_14]|nr:MAG: hypothetical protein AUJ72_00410 [Candidatus Omnitrophica bacterium CG1_02_46_14]
MKKLFIIFVFYFGILPNAHSFTLSNFDTPESFVSDPEDGAYYVSNVNGDPSAKDGDGYISKIQSAGNITIQKFIGGKKDEPLLNAPKGLCIVGKNIYVTDIDTVKAFDKETGKPTQIFDLSKFNVRFLNDIAADDKGRLYVSDTSTDQIFKIDSARSHEVTIFKEGKELGGPNGLFFNPKTKGLIVAGYVSGHIFEIDRTGKIHVLKRGLIKPDGLDYDSRRNLYISGFEKGEIYKISRMGRGLLEVFMSGLVTPADISCDRAHNELLIPSFDGNKVMTVKLDQKKPA